MLRAKPLPIDTFRENVVVLSRRCCDLRPERLSGTRKVEVRSNGRTILATIVIADDPDLVAPDQAGLTQPAFRRLGASPDAPVSIEPARPPRSLSSVGAKIRGESLDGAQLREVAADLAAHRWSDMEVAAFLVACASFMTTDETIALSRAMAEVGERLDWGRDLVVDKHCVGGIPGNRTSLVIVPIVAAHGLTIPKTSSRAITSPAGTADTMEVFARVDLGMEEMRATVEACNGCVVWGGRVNLSPADDVLISVERPLSIDTPEQMVASILSKKVAAGSTRLVVDMPVGPSAKIREPRSALRMRKLFEHVAAAMGISVEVVVTDGSQPVGRGVGPVLEMRDVLAVLEGRADAPQDLAEKAVALAGRVLEADPDLRGGAGEARARELLASGAARAKLDEIGESQGAPPVKAELGDLVHEVKARKAGWIDSVDCLQIARIARLAGAPTDPGAGVDLLKRKGDPVRAGEPLYRIHGVDPSDFGFAVEQAEEDSGFHAA